MIAPYLSTDLRGAEIWILRVHDDKVRAEVAQYGYSPLGICENANAISTFLQSISKHPQRLGTFTENYNPHHRKNTSFHNQFVFPAYVVPYTHSTTPATA